MPNKKVSNAAIVKILESRPLVEYFILERFSEDYNKNSWTIPKKYKVKKNGETYTYVLDSAVLRDTKKQHFSAYITCNGKSLFIHSSTALSGSVDEGSVIQMKPLAFENRLSPPPIE